MIFTEAENAVMERIAIEMPELMGKIGASLQRGKTLQKALFKAEYEYRVSAVDTGIGITQDQLSKDMSDPTTLLKFLADAKDHVEESSQKSLVVSAAYQAVFENAQSGQGFYDQAIALLRLSELRQRYLRAWGRG